MLTQVIEGRDSNILTIEYMLSNVCNYKCSYCFPGSNEGDYSWPNYDLLIQNISHLFETYKKQGKNKFEFYLLGGEPTLWKDITKFCTFLKENYDVVIRISTNAYRKPDWWKENAKLFDSIEISVHHEFAKVDHIIEVGDILYQQKTNLVTNVLMDPNHYDKCLGILNKLKTSKKRWPIIAKTVHKEGQINYTDDQKEYLKRPLKRYPNLFWWFTLPYHHKYKTWAVEDGKKIKVEDNYFIINNKNRFKGWECNLGVDHLHIHKDGTLTGSCTQLLYKSPTYYNLYDSEFVRNFNPTIQPVICDQPSCNCGFETKVTKRMIGDPNKTIWIKKI